MQRILRNLVFVSLGAGAALLLGVASAQGTAQDDPSQQRQTGTNVPPPEEPSFGGAGDAGMGRMDAGMKGKMKDGGMGGAGDAGGGVMEEENIPGTSGGGNTGQPGGSYGP